MNQRSLALGALSDEVLLARLVDVLSRGRRVEAEIIAHIAEVDARRLYLGQACSSMHVYVTERLHLSDAEAYLRITVARLSRRFPVVLAMLADGRAHLSGLVRLAPHLSDENADEILGRASFRSKREIELLVAELAPRPDAPPRIRRLPAAQTRPTAGAAAPPTAGSVEPNAGPPVDAHDLVPDRAETPTTLSSGAASPGAAGPAASFPPTARRRESPLAPLSPGRFRVQFTAGSELHGKIVRAQALLRREIPDGDLAAVFDRALTLLVREVERVRFAVTASPRKDAAEADPTPSSRRVPDPIRRAVWIRDGGQCTFRDGRGHRCSARERIELHHVTPFGRGGDHGADNLRLVCAAHNAHQASLDYGARFMDDRRVSRSGPRLPDQMSGASSSRPQPV